MRNTWRRAAAGVAVVALGSAYGLSTATADDLQLSGPSSVTAGRNTDMSFTAYVVQTNNSPTGDLNGCNVNPNSPATLSFSSSNGSVAAAPASVQVTACDDPNTTPLEGGVQVTVHVKADAPAGQKTTITVSGTGGKIANQTGSPLYTSDSIDITVEAQVAQGDLALNPVSPAVYDQTYPLTLASGGSGTGAYSYASTASSDACTVPSATVAQVKITKGTGTCAVTVTRAGDATYLPKTSAPLTIAVSKATQTLTFAQPVSPQTYGSSFAVAPSASSGLPVAVSVSGPCSVVTADGATTVTMTSGQGDCLVTAAQDGDGNWSGASLTRTVAAAQRPLTVTADAKAKSYGDADPALTYVVSGSLVGTDAVTGSLTRAAGEDVGRYSITQGSVTAGDNYALTYRGADLTIGQRVVAVAADAKEKVYGDADPALTYRITSGSLAAGDAFTGSLARVAGEDVGTHAITQGTLALSTNYSLSFTGAALSVTARPITVTAKPASKTYGDDDPAFEYAVTKGSLAFSDALTGSLARDAGEDVGSYALTQGDLSAGSNYALTFVGDSLTISPRPVEVTADAKDKVYGDADPTLTYAVTAGSLVFGDAFTGSLSRAAGEAVGTYAIGKGTLALTDNYTLAFVGSALTVSARPITVTADPQEKVYGDGDPVLSYVLKGHLVFDDAFTGSLSRAAGEAVGKHAIEQGTLALSDNYALEFVGADLTITPRPLQVTAQAATKTYGDSDPAFGYAITQGSLAFTDALTGALSRAAGEDVGSYGITQGTLSAGANYALTFVGDKLTITQRAVTVTADAKTKVYGGTDPALTYQLTTGSLAFRDTFTGALSRAAGEPVGDYAIGQGTLALSGNYALSFTGATFTITPARLTVTASSAAVHKGDAVPTITPSYSGWVAGEGPSVITVAPTCSTTYTPTSGIGSYPSSCSGAVVPNYDPTYVDGAVTVTYGWHGFFAPVDVYGGDASVATVTPSTVFNRAKAGSAIPVKFDLSGDQGLNVLASGSPTTLKVACPSTGTFDAVEELATGTTSGLKYDATTNAPYGQYNYTWKTATTLAGTCQRLQVKLTDGTSHYAFFQFTK